MAEPIRLNEKGELIKDEKEEAKKKAEAEKAAKEKAEKDSDTKDEPTTTKEDEDDIVLEEEEGGEGPEVIKKLREKLKKTIKEKQEYLDGWQRAKAEFLNIRKRDQDANEQYLKFAKEDLILQLIPVLDSFEMAFANKESWEKVDKNWRVGVEHIYSQLIAVLTSNNVVSINPLGEKFDPLRDEAVEQEPVNEERFDHTITKVISKGYKLNGKLIKPTKVKIGVLKKA